MLARARREACEIVAGAALWRCCCRSRGRRSILCIWVCVCVAGAAFGSCLKGQDVVARAAGGVRNRGRRSVRQLSNGTGCCRARGGGRAKSWQAQHFGDAIAEVVAGAAFCASGCVCVAGAAFGSCLKGQDVVARAAGGVRNRGRRSVRQLSNGTGCCRARGGGRAKSWQAQRARRGGVRNRGRRSTLAMPLPKSWQALHSVHLCVEMPLPKSWMSCSKLDKLLHGCPAKPSALLMDSQCRRSGPRSVDIPAAARTFIGTFQEGRPCRFPAEKP